MFVGQEFPIRPRAEQGHIPIFGVWGLLAAGWQINDFAHGIPPDFEYKGRYTESNGSSRPLGMAASACPGLPRAGTCEFLIPVSTATKISSAVPFQAAGT